VKNSILKLSQVISENGENFISKSGGIDTQEEEYSKISHFQLFDIKRDFLASL
jgi:hypothetical protein